MTGKNSVEDRGSNASNSYSKGAWLKTWSGLRLRFFLRGGSSTLPYRFEDSSLNYTVTVSFCILTHLLFSIGTDK